MDTHEYATRKQELIALITAVFDGVRRGEGITLHEARVIEDYGSEEERAKARKLDRETRWQDVPHEDMRTFYATLFYLDTAGFHYYLPAYLLWYLQYMDGDDPTFFSNTFDTVDYVLAAGYSGSVDAHFLDGFTMLTTEQSRAVAQYLAFLAVRETELLSDYDAYLANLREEWVVRGEATRAEIEADKADSQQFREKYNVSYETAAPALARYWGQFL